MTAGVLTVESAVMDPGKAARRLVLLVEDNPDDVLLVKRAFRKAELKCPLQVVTDGEQAVDYLAGAEKNDGAAAQALPVLVLLDYRLPRKSGLEVLQWIRSRLDLATLPVVVLTSSKEPETIRAAYLAGANSYLLKPVDFQRLIELVKALNSYWLGWNEAAVL
jgi:CheY-like chemotaxis protein